MRPVKSLRPAPGNARRHKKADLAVLAESLRSFGQRKPVVLDAAGLVIAGAGTLAAAKALGWTELWVAPSELTGADAVAYALADNRTAELSEWDEAAAEARMLDAGDAAAWLPMRSGRGLQGGLADVDMTPEQKHKPGNAKTSITVTCLAADADAVAAELEPLRERYRGLAIVR